jgi:hypothetical protein
MNGQVIETEKQNLRFPWIQRSEPLDFQVLNLSPWRNHSVVPSSRTLRATSWFVVGFGGESQVWTSTSSRFHERVLEAPFEAAAAVETPFKSLTWFAVCGVATCDAWPCRNNTVRKTRVAIETERRTVGGIRCYGSFHPELWWHRPSV